MIRAPVKRKVLRFSSTKQRLQGFLVSILYSAGEVLKLEKKGLNLAYLAFLLIPRLTIYRRKM